MSVTVGGTDEQLRLRRRLLRVLALDAFSVTGLVVLALAARSRPSGPGYEALARTAAASLLPGAVAVVREQRAHRPGAPERRHLLGTVVLLLAGSTVSTAGSARVLTGYGGGRVRTLGSAVLLGGNAVLVPYLAVVWSLHRRLVVRRPGS